MGGERKGEEGSGGEAMSKKCANSQWKHADYTDGESCRLYSCSLLHVSGPPAPYKGNVTAADGHTTDKYRWGDSGTSEQQQEQGEREQWD